jgi:hypothetical protein
MDCEKFEPLLLDELYEELDEVTSAAVKRHVSGCARCATILNGMRSTRRAVALPMLEMPAGLEDRILSSVKEAQKVVPIQSRAARALSWAGSWAMRPQTAMAAVFLLMIGTSAFVIRSRPSQSAGPGASGEVAAVSVTEKGEPAGQAPSSDDHDSLDNKAAAAAHGANMPTPSTLPPTPTPAASNALALNADPAAGPLDGLTAGKGRSKADDGKAFASALADEPAKDKDGDLRKEESQSQRGNVGKKAPPRDLGGIDNAGAGNAAAPAGAPYQNYAPNAQAVAPPPNTRSSTQEPQDGFSAGAAAYRSRNFTEATRQFDRAAASGDQNAALWAAKSVRDGTVNGCATALIRFDTIANRSAGTQVGNEALLDAARCQIVLGQLDPARDKLARLIKTPAHNAEEAKKVLAELTQVASRREAEKKAGAGGGAGASRPAAASPARAPAPAAPPATKPAAADGY